MAKITFQQIVASVQRMPGLERVTLGEIMDAVQTAATDIGNMPWPWNYAETNILLPAPFTAGTINITTGTNLVTTAPPQWAAIAGQKGWRVRLGNNNLDYIIQTIAAGQLTLVQNVNLSANIVNGTYTLYKDTYTYPTNYIFGSDVGLYQPTIMSRVQKIPRSKFEAAMNAGLRSFSTNISMFYCDQGLDPATGVYQFRLAPPTSGPAELRLCYHSIANTFTTSLLPVTDLPEGFDDVITLVAASKLYDTMMKAGESNQVKSLADGKIKLLRRLVMTQTIDDLSNPATEVSDSSISQWGMIIQRLP